MCVYASVSHSLSGRQNTTYMHARTHFFAQLGILLSVRSCYAPEGGPSFFVRMEEVEEMTKVWKEEQEAAAEAERKARVEAELEAGRSAPEAAVSPASGSASAFASKPVSTVGEMVGLSLCACTLSSSMSSAAALSPAMNGRVKIKLDPDAEGDVGGEREQQSETRRVSMYDQYMHSRRLHATVQKNADSNSNTIRNSNRGNNDSSSSANPILRKHLTDVTRGSSSASRSIAGADAVNIDAADAADAEDTEDLDEEVQAMIETVEGYLSTHPANLKRYQDTIAWIPAAVELRNSDGTRAFAYIHRHTMVL